MALDFPATSVGLSLVLYVAPRCIKTRGAVSRPVEPTASILTGDGDANNFARAVLFDALERLHNDYFPRGVASAQWVDDINQRAEGPVHVIAAALSEAAGDFCKSAQALGLQISGKSVEVASSLGLARDISQAVKDRSQGACIIKPSSTVADLGLDRGSGRRQRRKHGARVAMSLKQLHKIKRVSKVGRLRRARKKIVLMSPVPRFQYGALVHGMAPSVVSRTQASMGAALGGPKTGRCLTTFLALELGSRMPAVELVLRQFTSFFELTADPALARQIRARLHRSWPTVAKKLLAAKANRRWSRVSGPISGILAVLLDHGRLPQDPESLEWLAPAGSRWRLELPASGFIDFEPFVREVLASVWARLWRRVAKHHHGTGAADGLDLYSLRQWLFGLDRKASKQALRFRGSLVAVATAATWPRGRLLEVGTIEECDAVCQRCSANAIETDLHRYWECAANCNIPACVDTQDLERRAHDQASSCPVFWLRGLIPSGWTEVTPPGEAHIEWSWNHAVGGSGTAHGREWWGAGDGSGGPHSKDPRLRRCSWSCCTLAQACSDPSWAQIQDVSGLSGGVPGPVQTGNRAELLALVRWVEVCAGPGRLLHFITDSSYVVRGVCARGKRPRRNRDLWRRLWEALGEAQLTTHKVESHASVSRAEFLGMPELWRQANDMVDRMADAAAHRFQLSGKEVDRVQETERLAARVRKRLVAVMEECACVDPRGPGRIEHAPPRQRFAKAAILDRALAATAHDIVRPLGRGGKIGSRFSCRCCLESRGGPRQEVLEWLASPCSAVRAEIAGNSFPVPPGTRVADRVIHPSHKARAHSQVPVFFCSTCGLCSARENGVLRGLADECRPPSKAGVGNLQLLERGLWPGHSQAAKAFNKSAASHTGGAA